ncbi:hypothetical protein B5X24_HaOG209608 [Helicoverpa armigera]|nr:hypothetical protein B5X24_HaOG209608 [Helicoverpa armigera]
MLVCSKSFLRHFGLLDDALTIMRIYDMSQYLNDLWIWFVVKSPKVNFVPRRYSGQLQRYYDTFSSLLK